MKEQRIDGKCRFNRAAQQSSSSTSLPGFARRSARTANRGVSVSSLARYDAAP